MNHPRLPDATAATSVTAWIIAHLAGVEHSVNIVIGILTAASLIWSIFASRAKKRHYDRLEEERDESDEAGA